MLFFVFAVVVDLVGVFAVDVLFTFLDAVLEVPKALTQRAANLGQLAGTEDNHDEYQYDDQLCCAQSDHVIDSLTIVV